MDTNVIHKAAVTLKLSLILFAALAVACNPRGLPGFKHISEREEDRETRRTEEAIKNSPALQELDLCLQRLPKPNGFMLVNKSGDSREKQFLSYGYASNLTFETVRQYYERYFAEHGWQFVGQRKGGWGDPYIEYRNEKYQVTVYDMGATPRFRYKLGCELAKENIGAAPLRNPER